MDKLLHFLLIVIFIITNACAADNRFSRKSELDSTLDRQKGYFEGQKISGLCSYYGVKFQGRKTASGEIYNMYDFTAAHKDLPFGSIINVKNINTEKSVQVRINDRGPFKKDRILDLSFAAAQKIDLIKDGTTMVEITILKIRTEN